MAGVLAAGTVVCPGDPIGAIASVQSGPGTYVADGVVLASRCGRLAVAEDDAQPGAATASVASDKAAPLVPSVGDIATARVTRITPRLAAADILCLGARKVEVPFTGIIRAQDVRATEIDKVVIADCFRPGDLVRAEVVSLGTQRDYFLGTARNELGVIWARSRAGAAMAAVSWTQMRCPNTGQVEARKVARVTAA